MLLLFINVKDKTSQRVKTDVNFGSAHALFVICTRVSTLHSCCMTMHSFSADKKHVFFSCTLLRTVCKA